jgi:hypothetical protein
MPMAHIGHYGKAPDLESGLLDEANTYFIYLRKSSSRTLPAGMLPVASDKWNGACGQ